MTGRPSSYTQEIGDEICRRYAAGETLAEICATEGFPHISTLYDWRKAIIPFGEAFARAQELHADTLADEVKGIADKDHDPQRAKNRMAARQWLAGKLNRDKYGDKIDISKKVTVEVVHAIEDGLQRVRSIRDQSMDAEYQVIDIQDEKQPIARDRQSDDDDIFS